MNSKIGELLDLYVKLSNESYDINDILEDIERYDKLIPEITKKIERLERGIEDNKYFDASSEIIDRNIEVSLQKKLEYLKNKLASLRSKNEELIKSQQNDEQKYISLNKALSSCKNFIYDLSKFDYEISSSNILRLIEMEKERCDSITNQIDLKEEKKEQSEFDRKSIGEEISSLEKSIQNEEDRLIEIKSALMDKNSYIDEEAKAEDLKELSDLKNELNDVKQRRAELISSITYQTYIIKEELISDNVDKENIMNIITNITSRLNDLPYLSIEDDTLLDEEYNQLSSQRDELMAVIENKKYNLKNKKPYEIRYEYLEQKLNNVKDIKEDYESLLKFIINQDIEVTTDNLLKLKEEQKDLNNAFSSSNKAVQQRQYIDELIISYEEDLTKTLEKAREIKEKIQEQEHEVVKYSQEIKNLSGEKKLHFDLENQVEKEHDNNLLQDLIKKLEYLVSRKSSGTTPGQILDQIEMLLYENEKEEITEIPTEHVEDNIEIEETNNSDYTFEKLSQSDTEDYNNEEMIIQPKHYNVDNEEEKEFSFSPIDNTGFVSFEDAYNSAKNKNVS